MAKQPPGQFAKAVCLTLAASSAAGCVFMAPVVPEQLPAGAAQSVELTQVPFFPQADYQCGPAALATILQDSGVAVSADELTGEVFLPGRRGSLQIELVAAVRRHGRLPYPVHGALPAILAHLDAGYPVLVLQNLGFERLPRWHYAVVVGYSGANDTMILRSGTTRRERMPAREFLRKWQDGEQWALLALRPGDIPPAAVAEPYVSAAASLEHTGHARAARRAYQAAIARWPDNHTARLGLANTAYSLGDPDTAITVLRRLVDANPDHFVARNNLAHVLAEQGCPTRARDVLDPVLANGRAPQGIMEQVRQTLAEIDAPRGEAERSHCRPPASNQSLKPGPPDYARH